MPTVNNVQDSPSTAAPLTLNQQSGIVYAMQSNGASTPVNLAGSLEVADGGAVSGVVTEIIFPVGSVAIASGVATVSGGGSYSGTATTNVGGIANGQSFTAQTLQQMFDALIAPYPAPGFTAFSISGISSAVEVGYSYSNPTFNWSTSNSGNVTANTIGITDTTLSTTIASGLANSGSYAATAAAVTRSTAGTHAYGISGTNTHSGSFSGSLNVTWQWRFYYGPSTNVTLTNTQILALASSQLATGYAGTYVETAAGYKYLCFADAAGGQINSVKDSSTGFSIPMATSTDNAAYSNVDGGGFSYAIVSVTNAQSITTNVRVYRSQNNLGGAVTLLVA